MIDMLNGMEDIILLYLLHRIKDHKKYTNEVFHKEMTINYNNYGNYFLKVQNIVYSFHYIKGILLQYHYHNNDMGKLYKNYLMIQNNALPNENNFIFNF